MALLGHELRHAVELAEAPAVDDDGDYQRLYDRIGYQSCSRAAPRCYETDAAVRAGRAVLTELRKQADRRRRGDRRRPFAAPLAGANRRLVGRGRAAP